MSGAQVIAKETSRGAAHLALAGRFLRIAALWLFACVALGVYMGVAHVHVDKQIHVHGNLLGWASCALFAACHRLWPALGRSRLAHGHFWLHNIGLVALAIGLGLTARAHPAAAPFLGAGSVCLVAASAIFLVLVWRTPLAGTDQMAAVLRDGPT